LTDALGAAPVIVVVFKSPTTRFWPRAEFELLTLVKVTAHPGADTSASPIKGQSALPRITKGSARSARSLSIRTEINITGFDTQKLDFLDRIVTLSPFLQFKI
jgi:hypothetical protein